MSLNGKRVLHKLKCMITPTFGVEGTVQIRKNDRGFKVNDAVVLSEVGPDGVGTGCCQVGILDHVIEDFEGLEEGYVVLSITPVDLLVHEGEKYVTRKRTR